MNTYPCRFCGDRFQHRGLRPHEQWCDENPNPGTPPDRQEGDSEPETKQGSIDQSSAVESEQTLPETSVIGGNSTDTGGCPRCGESEVIPAEEAAKLIQSELDHLPDRLVGALSLSTHFCGNPDCGALWNDRSEARTMEEIL